MKRTKEQEQKLGHAIDLLDSLVNLLGERIVASHVDMTSRATPYASVAGASRHAFIYYRNLAEEAVHILKEEI